MENAPLKAPQETDIVFNPSTFYFLQNETVAKPKDSRTSK
jgi:hypothetical protein